jgi:hypothetical protein
MTVLLYTFGITIILAIIIQYFLWKDRKKQLKAMEKDWPAFLSAARNNDVARIKSIGEKIVWNTHLKGVQMDEMIEVINQHIEENPELKQLRIDLFNKKNPTTTF